MALVNLKELSQEQLGEFTASLGLPGYRAEQITHWIYEKGVADINGMTVLSKALRAKLSAKAYIGTIKLLERQDSADGTAKFLFGLEHGKTIESVAIPEGQRLTLCISSQAGCALGCRFCLTGAKGLKGNLSAFEITEQVMAAGRLLGRRITNIVLMGMGEPLMNFKEVTEALGRITGLLGFSPRRVTLSTAGIVPQMLKLSGAAPPVNLAVSLNATTDKVRDFIMPINKKYPLATLLAACRAYPLPKRTRITFEYVMLRGVNDSDADALRLKGLLRGIPCKVNLIPFNEHPGSSFKTPGEERVLQFQDVLVGSGLTALLRKSKGLDILAACGQLSGAG